MDKQKFNKKRGKKQNYKQQFQASKRNEEIKQSLCGFLVTCDQSKEKRCVKELFNVLNEYVEKLYPELDINEIVKSIPKPQKWKKEEAQVTEVTEEKDDRVHEVRPDDLIKQEIDALRKQRIFFVFNTGTSGVIFIKLLDELRPYIDVNKLGMAVINDIVNTKESSSRFACRFLPIEILCKAKIDDFKGYSKPILAKYFSLAKEEGEEVKQDDEPIKEEEYKTWSMEFKNKNNNNIKKKEVLDFIFKTVDGHKNPVDLKNADLNIVIEVYRDILMFTVVPKYHEYKKFNLQQLVKREDDNESQSDGEPRKVVKLADLIGKRQQREEQQQQDKGNEDQDKEEEKDDDNEDDKEQEQQSSDSSDEEEVRLL